jgi:hypothetical protein
MRLCRISRPVNRRFLFLVRRLFRLTSRYNCCLPGRKRSQRSKVFASRFIKDIPIPPRRSQRSSWPNGRAGPARLIPGPLCLSPLAMPRCPFPTARSRAPPAFPVGARKTLTMWCLLALIPACSRQGAAQLPSSVLYLFSFRSLECSLNVLGMRASVHQKAATYDEARAMFRKAQARGEVTVCTARVAF